jgi:rhamnulokinase
MQLEELHRFANRPVRLPDSLRWNLLHLFTEALSALKGRSFDGVGVDTWGVDYALLDERNRVLGLPFHYRDERTDGVARVEGYEITGIQHMPINTVYQLRADDRVDDAERIALVPDLLAYWLCGELANERTNASTTGLLDVTTRAWDTELMIRLGLDPTLFTDLVDPGDLVGDLLPPVAERVGGVVPVVAVGSHDTASAVVGVPMQTDDAAYVSLGTWALAGLELDAPVLTEEARVASLTNEGGVDGTVRFLSNVMGTWLLSETLRTWGETDLAGTLRAAAGYDGPVPVVDVQDPRFLPPGDIEARIRAWCAEHDVAPPNGRVAVVRCIVESIAAAIGTALQRAAALAGRRVGVVHVVGGGSQNTLLCQAIADRTGLPVLAGPVEATALGNVLVQARAAGIVGPDLADLRALVARTHDLATFQPRG